MSGKPYPTAPPQGSYPSQYPAYPTGQYPQPQYQTGYPYQQNPYDQSGGMYSGPPPYSAQPQEPPPPYSPYPGQPAAGQPPMPVYPQQQQQQQQMPTTVMVPGMYHAGARFDGISQPRIPPPPPGVAPNPAQMAAMQGHNVVGTQQRANWFSGNCSSDNWGF